MKNEIIYIAVENEGTKVWRPMFAEKLDDETYKINVNNDYDPTDEKLKFLTWRNCVMQNTIIVSWKSVSCSQKIVRNIESLPITAVLRNCWFSVFSSHYFHNFVYVSRKYSAHNSATDAKRRMLAVIAIRKSRKIWRFLLIWTTQ